MSRISHCSPSLSSSLGDLARRVVRSGSFTVGFALFLLVFAGGSRAFAAASTSTTLAVTSQGSAVTSVASGTVVTLTATVTAGSAPVTLGTVNFCDASATYCTDIHLLGTAQLTSAGTAVLKFRPGVGSHSYKAVFAGTNSNPASNSSTATLTVTESGLYATSTTIAQSGNVGNYTLTATVGGIGLSPTPPTGTVSFLDTSDGNALLGTATLGPGTSGLNFLNSSNPATGGAPTSVAVGDFNGDGIPDLAVAGEYSSSVTVLLGNGDGTFTATATGPATCDMPFSLAVGDFNGDGIQDLAVANLASNTVTVLLGNGDGTFTPTAASPATGKNPRSLAVGDFNGDGIQDLAVANLGSNTVTVLLGNGDGTFTPAATSPATGSSPYFIAVGDFNGDGIQDLAVANGGSGTVTILLGNGDGTFTATAVSPATGTSASIAVGDFNGDGIPDLAVAVEITDEDNAVTILLGKGDGTFTATATSPGTDYYSLSIAVGDFNGDGLPDLATANYENWRFDGDTVTVLLTERTQTAIANGIGVLPVATGTHLVLATYSGDSNYAPSTSGTTSLTANQGTPTVSVTASANPAAYGTPVTLTLTVTGSGLTPTGTVAFYYGTTQLGTGTLSGGVVTNSMNALAPGSYSITAAYGGDGNYVTATSAALSLTVTQATPTIVWPAPAPITYGTNLSAILDATAQSGSGITVPGTFAYTATPAGGTAVPVTTATILGIGSYTLGASFTPAYTNLYTTATGSVQLTVNPFALPPWLSSSGATAGGAGLTLQVFGANFAAKSVVLWNGAVRKTTYVSSTELTAAINAADIAKEATNRVTVANPAPNAGTSAALPFVVMSATPLAKISGGSIAVAAGSGGSHVLTLTGADFVTSSTVEWNGLGLTTTYVSPWQISAVITASDYSSLPAKVAVKNPAGTSPSFELP